MASALDVDLEALDLEDDAVVVDACFGICVRVLFVFGGGGAVVVSSLEGNSFPIRKDRTTRNFSRQRRWRVSRPPTPLIWKRTSCCYYKCERKTVKDLRLRGSKCNAGLSRMVSRYVHEVMLMVMVGNRALKTKTKTDT